MSRTDMERMAAELNERLARRGAPAATIETARGSDLHRSVVRKSGVITAEELLAAMNLERRRHDLPPLSLNTKLNAAADDRIADMFSQRYFDHVAPDGTSPFVWVKSRGYRYRTIGENLAEGQRSARAVVADWMNSPGHRRNILGRFDECGLAIAPGSPVRRSSGFTFVALYGSD